MIELLGDVAKGFVSLAILVFLPGGVAAVSAAALWADLPIHRPEIEKRIQLFLFSAEVRKGNDGAAEAEAIAKKEKRVD